MPIKWDRKPNPHDTRGQIVDLWIAGVFMVVAVGASAVTGHDTIALLAASAAAYFVFKGAEWE